MSEFLGNCCLILATLITLASSLDLSHTQEQFLTDSTTEATTTRPFEEFKNHQQLDDNVLPDISHLADKFRDKAKYGYLVGMLDVWKANLLADGRFKVSKGEFNIFNVFNLVCK